MSKWIIIVTFSCLKIKTISGWKLNKDTKYKRQEEFFRYRWSSNTFKERMKKQDLYIIIIENVDPVIRVNSIKNIYFTSL